LFDGFGEADKDFVGASDPVDLGQTAGFAIKIDEGLSLGLIEVKSAINGIRGVIVTLDHVSPAIVTAPLGGLGPRGLIVGATVTTDAPDGETSKDQITRNNKIYCKIERTIRGCLVE
jgi:hypothetical protein